MEVGRGRVGVELGVEVSKGGGIVLGLKVEVI